MNDAQRMDHLIDMAEKEFRRFYMAMASHEKGVGRLRAHTVQSLITHAVGQVRVSLNLFHDPKLEDYRK